MNDKTYRVIGALVKNDDRLSKFVTDAAYNPYLPFATRVADRIFDSYLAAAASTPRKLSSIILPNAKEIGYKAFYRCKELISVSAPKVTKIGERAFCGCAKLESLGDLTNVVEIEAYAFMDCDACTSLIIPNVINVPNFLCGTASTGLDNLTNVDIYSAVTIGEYAFCHCKSLSNINMPNVLEISEAAFKSSGITHISIPKCEKIGTSAFENCTSLKSTYMPNVITLSTSAFQNCTSLKSIYIPNVIALTNKNFRDCTSLIDVSPLNVTKWNASSSGSGVFRGCTSLPYVELLSKSSLAYGLFENCSSLRTLILRNEARSSCQSSTFTGTPFATDGTGGIALVPRSLIESYQTATNWSTLYAAGTCLFWALEDYTIDGTTTGEFDWDKLNTDREGAFITE